jgi:uncharacterized membrane protein YeaQ/YmgE (transglycosylase-associated protein family)
MDYQMLFNIAVGLAGAFAGFFLNAVWGALKELRDADDRLAAKVGSIEVLVAGQYVKRDEVNERFEAIAAEVFRRLDRIEQKLDGKVDRSECDRMIHGKPQ